MLENFLKENVLHFFIMEILIKTLQSTNKISYIYTYIHETEKGLGMYLYNIIDIFNMYIIQNSLEYSTFFITIVFKILSGKVFSINLIIYKNHQHMSMYQCPNGLDGHWIICHHFALRYLQLCGLACCNSVEVQESLRGATYPPSSHFIVVRCPQTPALLHLLS